MADKPDLNKLKNKFDFNSILDNLKSMINPAAGTPDVDPDDDLGVKIAQASVLLKEMVQHEHEHVKNMNQLNELLNAIYLDVDALRKEVQTDRAQRPVVSPEPKQSTESVEPVSKPEAQTMSDEKKEE